MTMMRDAWVAETRAEAEEVYGPEVIEAYKYYWRNGLPDFRGIRSEDEITLDNIGPDRLILGDPEECAAEFQRWSEAVGAGYFLLRLRHAHSGARPTRRSWRPFACSARRSSPPATDGALPDRHRCAILGVPPGRMDRQRLASRSRPCEQFCDCLHYFDFRGLIN